MVYRQAMNTLDFLIQKDQLDAVEIRETPKSALTDGQVRVRVDKFALTSNNITYAAFGNAMNYWKFFPVTASGAAGAPDAAQGAASPRALGIVPAWGFADVVQSACPGVAVGERFYGYFPMSSHVVLEPARLSAAGFNDAAAHRSALHAVYNQYLRCSADPLYTHQPEDVQTLLRPLFTTAWLIDDLLADNQFFGAQPAGTAAPGSGTTPGVALFAFTETASSAAQPWIKPQHHRGTGPMAAAYALVLGGQGDPRIGHMLSLR